MTTIEQCEYTTPLGPATGAWHRGRLVTLGFTDHWPRLEARLRRRFGSPAVEGGDPAPLQAALDAYFGGDLTALAAVAVDPGGTDFQRAVWQALRAVPCGATTTYSALARQIGAPRAVRAVGAANGANPIWLVIPCHRAIGADGALTGYAGGLERKRWLLAHEANAGSDSPGGRRSVGAR